MVRAAAHLPQSSFPFASSQVRDMTSKQARPSAGEMMAVEVE